jgi:hypothetical protein
MGLKAFHLNGLTQLGEAVAEILSKLPSGVLRSREDCPAFINVHDDQRWYFRVVFYDDEKKWAEAVIKSRNEPRDATRPALHAHRTGLCL